MNKRQKEVQQAFLESEKEVLSAIKKNYRDALKDIDEKIESLLARQDSDMQYVIYQVEYQKALKAQVEGILDQLHSNEFATVSDYLTKSYENGFIGTLYDLQGQGIPLIFPIDQSQVVDAIQHDTKLSESLYSALGKDIKELSKQIASEISRGISTGAMYADIARNIKSYSQIPQNNAMRIARTEAHRIQCQATADAQHKAKEKGADVVKQWDSTLDSKTRETHRELDGQIRELEEPFEVAGMKAMQPGGFGRPEEDINCRCALLQRARWALGESELQTIKDRAEYFGIDKAEDIEDYRIKYLDATIPQTNALITDNLHVYSNEEIEDIANQTNAIANKYVENASKWSGNIIVDDNATVYGKLWNCDIVTASETAPHIVLHEQLHAHSISYYDAQTYAKYMKIEEATVQMMAQEISKIEKIVIIDSRYDDIVMNLRDFNKIVGVYDSDFDFAKALIEMPVTDRIDWLESKKNEALSKGISIGDAYRLNDIINLLS